MSSNISLSRQQFSHFKGKIILFNANGTDQGIKEFCILENDNESLQIVKIIHRTASSMIYEALQLEDIEIIAKYGAIIRSIVEREKLIEEEKTTELVMDVSLLMELDSFASFIEEITQPDYKGKGGRE